MITPIFSILSVFALLLLLLWRRDGRLPLVDVGVFVALSTSVYSTFPAVQFILGDYLWDESSDNRLQLINPGPGEMASFLWGAAIYLTCFATIYLVCRGRAAAQVYITPTGADVAALVGVIAFAFTFRVAVEIWFQISVLQSNVELANDPAFSHLPVLVQQVLNHSLALARTSQIVIVVAIVACWRQWWAKWALLGLVGYELLDVWSRQGQRTSAVMLLVAACLAYHRFVRPLGAVSAGVAGAAVLGGALLYGFMREGGGDGSSIVATNEFQAMMGTPFHLAYLIDRGIIGDIPWQVYVSDLLMLVPQQLAPVEKIDPALWYLQQAGYDGGAGFLFGVMSQAVIGGGNYELAIRGVTLAIVLALIHRWQAKLGDSFWALAFYIWLCLMIYYAYRASTFYWVTFVVFQFLPLFIVAKLLKIIELCKFARSVPNQTEPVR